MKKKTIVKALMVLFMSLSFHGMSAQSAKVVIDGNGNEHRYLGETKTKYHIAGNDDSWILKKNARVEFRSAAKGQGFIYPATSGNKPVYLKPANSKVIDYVGYMYGDMPEMYHCRGVVNAYYKIETESGKIGFVLRSQFKWSSMSF